MRDVTVNIKFGDVELRELTLEQARELRDILDSVVGARPSVIERREYVPCPMPVYPGPPPTYWRPTWICQGGGTSTLSIDGGTSHTFSGSNITLERENGGLRLRTS